ncbi:MAG: hypothetical protein RBS16_01860 [Candidatus Cloacimonadales bacterium]|jgi:hypothetical protein|nr:hypothetical protein [Candidatus Cloacimonadales bacterium]
MAGNWYEVIDQSKVGAEGGVAGLNTNRQLIDDNIPGLDAGKITAGTLTVDRIPTLTAAKIPSLAISKITNLQTALDGKVATSRKIAGKALTADITLSASDVGARASTWTPAAADIPSLAISKITGLQTALDGKVATSRTINGVPLSNNITLTTGNLITKITGSGSLPTSGVEGEMVMKDGKLYVWRNIS